MRADLVHVQETREDSDSIVDEPVRATLSIMIERYFRGARWN